MSTLAAATAGRAWRLAILRSRLPPSGATDQVPTFWLPHLVATVRVIRLQKGMSPLAVELDIGTRKNSGRCGTRTGGTLTCASAGSSPTPPVSDRTALGLVPELEDFILLSTVT